MHVFIFNWKSYSSSNEPAPQNISKISSACPINSELRCIAISISRLDSDPAMPLVQINKLRATYD